MLSFPKSYASGSIFQHDKNIIFKVDKGEIRYFQFKE